MEYPLHSRIVFRAPNIRRSFGFELKSPFNEVQSPNYEYEHLFLPKIIAEEAVTIHGQPGVELVHQLRVQDLLGVGDVGPHAGGLGQSGRLGGFVHPVQLLQHQPKLLPDVDDHLVGQVLLVRREVSLDWK